MVRIENEAQYDWAMNRVEELLPLVDDNTPTDNPNSIELELLSNLVVDYDEAHFPMKQIVIENNKLEYKGYIGSVDYSANDHCLYGRVQGMSGTLISYEGETVKELERDFKDAVDSYIDLHCR